MVAVVAVPAAVVTALTIALVRSHRRRRDDPVLRRSRALAALGHVAELPHDDLRGLRRVESPTTSLRLLQPGEAVHRPPPSRPGPTARDASVRSRPTVAVLPSLPGRTLNRT